MGDDTAQTRAKDFVRFKNYAAWTFVVAAPVLLAMPPRKLDLHSFALVSAFGVSANHLYRDQNPAGRGIMDELGVRYFGRDSTPTSAVPREERERKPVIDVANLMGSLPTERAEKVQAQLRAAKEASMKTEAEREKYAAAKRFDERSLPEKIWMGSETEGWKERRLREEQEALAQGKGYGDLIMEHIWDVWNWGKPQDKKSHEPEDK